MNRKVRLELSVCLEISSFVGSVSVNDIGNVVLELSEGEEDDIALDYPDLQEYDMRWNDTE
jgi:hypothetical protein